MSSKNKYIERFVVNVNCHVALLGSVPRDIRLELLFHYFNKLFRVLWTRRLSADIIQSQQLRLATICCALVMLYRYCESFEISVRLQLHCANQALQCYYWKIILYWLSCKRYYILQVVSILIILISVVFSSNQ